MPNNIRKLTPDTSAMLHKTVNYKIYKHGGAYAEIYIGKVNRLIGNANKSKMYLNKYHGIKCEGLSKRNAIELCQNMQEFVKIAHELNIKVLEPISYSFSHPNGNPNKSLLIETVPYLGKSLFELLSSKNTSDKFFFQLIKKYLITHKKVWSADFPISLDPGTANYCYVNGEMVFIDMMPPRVKLYTNECITEWPHVISENSYFFTMRHFTKSQAKLIYTQIMRVASKRGINGKKIKSLIKNTLGDEVEKHLTISNSKLKRILSLPLKTDVDDIRLIALNLVEKRMLDADDYEKIHRLTHTKAGGNLPPMNDIKKAIKIISIKLSKHYDFS